MMTWRGRRILPLYGLLAAVGTLLLIGIPSDIIPNPIFGREVPVRWWEYPVLVVQHRQGARPPGGQT